MIRVGEVDSCNIFVNCCLNLLHPLCKRTLAQQCADRLQANGLLLDNQRVRVSVRWVQARRHVELHRCSGIHEYIDRSLMDAADWTLEGVEAPVDQRRLRRRGSLLEVRWKLRAAECLTSRRCYSPRHVHAMAELETGVTRRPVEHLVLPHPWSMTSDFCARNVSQT